MEVLPGTRVGNPERAAELALEAAGAEDANSYITDLFAEIADNDKFNSDAERIITTTIRNKYGSKVTWSAQKWCIPVPKLRYDSKQIPQITIEISVYLVAEVNTGRQTTYPTTTLVGPVGKPETLTLPIVFLHAILKSDLGRFSIIAKDTGFTTWGMSGMKPITLPNTFVNELKDIFEYQSVNAWLEEFGSQGRCIAPLVAGTLFGLEFGDSATPSILTDKQTWADDEEIITTLKGLAFPTNEARAMVNNARPHLRNDMPLEEVIRTVLQFGKGGNLQ